MIRLFYLKDIIFTFEEFEKVIIEFAQRGVDNPFYHSAVRRAFVLATDRRSIVQHATRLQEPIMTSFVPPNSIAGYGAVDGLGFDVDAARQELASAGWIDRDEDGFVEDAPVSNY